MKNVKCNANYGIMAVLAGWCSIGTLCLYYTSLRIYLLF